MKNPKDIRINELKQALRLMINNSCAACEKRGNEYVVPVTKREWNAHVEATRVAKQILED